MHNGGAKFDLVLRIEPLAGGSARAIL